MTQKEIVLWFFAYYGVCRFFLDFVCELPMIFNKMKMKKVFRVKKTDGSVLPYLIEQQHSLLGIFHLWSSPQFAPPHRFDNENDACDAIQEYYPKARIYKLLKN